jgi:UDP-glucose 4-epimerase
MRVCVVGGNGFIGSHLVDGLRQAKWKVIVLDRADERYRPRRQDVEYVYGELGNRRLLTDILSRTDVVFHLAYTTVPQTSNDDPMLDVRTNILDSISLLEVCVKVNVPRVIFLSSGGTVYGIPRQLPISEDHPTDPICSYGITKLAIEKYLALFYHLHSIDYTVLRPANPYGERQNPLGLQGAIAVFLGRIARGLPIVIWGDGAVVRDYFYVGDLVEACLAVVSARSEERVFNIGSGHGVSLNQLIEAITRVVSVDFKILYTPARPFDVPELVLDVSRAEHSLGWFARTSLEEGLERTWAWVRTLDWTEQDD